jgi:hypothetical protein
MSDLPGMPSTIRCTACGFENTTTSLYCQDCGVRLVPLPTAIDENPTGESADLVAQIRKSKPRILSVNRPNRSRSIFFLALRVLFFAAAVALIALLVLTPANLPPTPSPLSAGVIENVRIALQRSAQTGKPFVAPWSGEGLNAYLAGVLRPAKPPGGFEVTLAGALLSPTSDGFSLFTERNVLGVSIYTTVSYRLVSRGSGIGLVLTGAAAGRLPLPAWAAPAIELTNREVAKALAPELQILRGARNVQVTPQKAYVDFGPSRL